MPTITRLSDAIIPSVFESYQVVDDIELTVFADSGIVVQNAILQEKANSGGKKVEIPFWKDLDASQEPNYSDDTDNDADTDKLGSGEFDARVAYMNNGWAAMDLVAELAGSNPMKRIAARTDAYWAKQWQHRLIALTMGVYAENIANGGGDMVFDASRPDGLSATDANLFGRGAFTAAVFTLGDHFGMLSGMAVHSLVYKRMVDNDDIEFIMDSDGKLTIPTYMGKRVLVDDGMPKVAGAMNGIVYTSVLFGQGAIGYGQGKPLVPVATQRFESKGNGGGLEQLWQRRTWLMHPFGYKWNEVSVTGGVSPNNADMANAANWTRQIARKNIPLAFLRTNG